MGWETVENEAFPDDTSLVAYMTLKNKRVGAGKPFRVLQFEFNDVIMFNLKWRPKLPVQVNWGTGDHAGHIRLDATEERGIDSKRLRINKAGRGTFIITVLPTGYSIDTMGLEPFWDEKTQVDVSILGLVNGKPSLLIRLPEQVVETMNGSMHIMDQTESITPLPVVEGFADEYGNDAALMLKRTKVPIAVKAPRNPNDPTVVGTTNDLKKRLASRDVYADIDMHSGGSVKEGFAYKDLHTINLEKGTYVASTSQGALDVGTRGTAIPTRPLVFKIEGTSAIQLRAYADTENPEINRRDTKSSQGGETSITVFPDDVRSEYVKITGDICTWDEGTTYRVNEDDTIELEEMLKRVNAHYKGEGKLPVKVDMAYVLKLMEK